MSEYLTTESEISELSEWGDEYQELSNKNNNLLNELENIRKELKDKEYEMMNTITMLELDNEKLKSTNNSYEDLLEFYKNQETSNIKTSTGAELMKRNIELTNKVNDLEAKLFASEQNDHNLKRENFTLNSVINDYKYEIEKLQNDESLKRERKISNTNSDNDNRINNLELNEDDLDNLILEIEDLRREKTEIQERALNMLTEKEIIVIELREQIDDLKMLKIKHEEELNNLKSDNKHFENFHMKFDNNYHDSNHHLEEDLENLKKECFDKENTWEHERERLNQLIKGLEDAHKNTINDFENELNRYKTEIHNYILEKSILEKEIIRNKDSKYTLANELDNYNSNLSKIMEEREKDEVNYKNQIKSLKEEIKELDKNINIYREDIYKYEKQINGMKTDNMSKISNIQDKLNYDLLLKDKEMEKYKEKLDFLEKEKDNIKKDNENNKKINEKSKNEYKEIIEQLKKIKEHHEEEKRKWEEKILNIEKSHELERSYLNDQINSFKNAMNPCYTSSSVPKTQNNNIQQSKNTSDNTPTTLAGCLSSEENINTITLKNKITALENEITSLNNKIKIKESKNVNVFRLNGEIEILKKEKAKIKTEFNEMKEMYEIQIKDLLQKLNMSSVEKDGNNARRRTSALKPDNYSSKHLIENIDLEEKLNRFRVENKFLNDQLEILKKELENIKMLKESQIKKIKEELEIADHIAANAKVALAQVAYEKDLDVLKYKRLCKKLKNRLGNTNPNYNGNMRDGMSMNNITSYNSNNPILCNSATPNKKKSFLQNLFK